MGDNQHFPQKVSLLWITDFDNLYPCITDLFMIVKLYQMRIAIMNDSISIQDHVKKISTTWLFMVR